MKTTTVATLVVIAFNLAAVACVQRPMRAAAFPYASSTSPAAQAFEEGVTAFGRAEYARAVNAFERALEIAPRPVVLFNLARVHEVMGHDARAAHYYLAYLACESEASPDLVAISHDALDRLRRRVAWIRIRSVVTVEVEDAQVLATDRDVYVPLEPGLRRIRVGDDPPVMVRTRAGEVFSIECGAPRRAVVMGASDFDSTPWTPRNNLPAASISLRGP